MLLPELMNFMRNIGQSIGTSALTTVLARGEQFHQSVLAPHTSAPRLRTAMQGLAMQLNHAGLSLHLAQNQATDRLYNMVQSQAAALAYLDAYWLLAVTGAIMFVASFLLKPNNPYKSANVAIH
jgi:DHA2 family multidrug resistance protein